MKRILIGIIGIMLAVSTFSVAFAAAPTSWTWTMCNAATVKGNLGIEASVGSSQVFLAYNVPVASYENTIDGCQKESLTVVTVTISPDTAGGLPSTFTSYSASNSFELTAVRTVCQAHGTCETMPYNFVKGDGLTLDIAPTYGDLYTHGFTHTYNVPVDVGI